MFRRTKLTWSTAGALARFLNDMRGDNPTLSSQGYQRSGAEAAALKATESAIMQSECSSSRLGTFLLHSDDSIIACVQVDERKDDGRVALFSNAETHPEYQRRGTFWRHLGVPCIRVFSRGNFDRLEAVTWTYNRKGIPVYKRFGFRAVPETSLLLENYLPTIVKHPATRGVFSRHDYLRHLVNTRSYGYDSLDGESLRVFQYRWEHKGEALEVLVDWERRQIACIERDDWRIWCYTSSPDPFIAHYEVENRSEHSLVYCIHKCNGTKETTRMQSVLPGETSSGDIYVAEDLEWATAIFELGGELVPFRLRRGCRAGAATRVQDSSMDRRRAG